MSEAITQRAAVKWEDFAPAAIDNSKIKILAVDDNEPLRYSLVRTLREAGYRVVEARTGTEALSLAAETPDLITLDVHLPDMLGFDVCKQLKSNPVTAHIPILHLSSTYVDPEWRVRGLSSGADAYLTEPIDRGELVATVGALLRLKNAENLARQQAAAAEDARRELAQLNETLERKVAERTTELRTANDSLRELSRRLLRTQDEERRRIARELHDSVGQSLAAIKMNNAAIAEQQSIHAQTLKDLRSNDLLVDEILRSIRTISHLLHPPLLDESGLPSALRLYVEEFTSRSGIKVDFDCAASRVRLSCDMETALFRVAQECLGNVHRHSSSLTASIHFNIDNDTAYLEVNDQGLGISVERQREIAMGGGGVGFRGMRERIAQLGGKFQLRSDSKGTTVAVAVPIERTVAA